MNLERLKTLTEHSQKNAQQRWKESPETILRLPENKKRAWKKLIASVSTVESIENTILRPASKHFRDPVVQEYLQTHAQDEFIHATIFAEYVADTFQYRKEKRSISDQVIYDRLLPRFVEWTENHPLPSILAIYFYELYAAPFYTELKNAAERDGLTELVSLIEAVEKDELRHIAGIEAIVELYRAEKTITLFDRIATSAVLNLLLLDVNQSQWAIHNRHVRNNLLTLEINVTRIIEKGKRAAQETMALLEERA